jgi:hypothetical protein
VKKSYFFGYLFVRGAKTFALIALAAGAGFCLLQYSQAETATAAAAYHPSLNLQQALRKLQEAFSATQELVDSFNKDQKAPELAGEPPKFPTLIESNDDFQDVGEELIRVDQERQRLKQSVVGRFEASVATIEEKLRNYAANLEPARSTGTPANPPSPTVGSILSNPPPLRSTLFSPGLGTDDVRTRSASLAQQKEFLKYLETKAENAENRATLNAAANQLDQLSKLLPEKTVMPGAAQLNASASPEKEPLATEGRTVSLSERVAGQLDQLRSEVRQSLLTSWKLDDAFDQATELASVEREKCRVAALTQKGIWLSAGSKTLPGIFAALLLSFLILVFADLVRTLLDTAANTGTVADAINAMRGSVVRTPAYQPESMFIVEDKPRKEEPKNEEPRNEEPRNEEPRNEEPKKEEEEEMAVQGGS